MKNINFKNGIKTMIEKSKNKLFEVLSKPSSEDDLDKKYEIVKGNNKLFNGIEYFRIRALKDFYDVRKGDFGGYIESEDNLSQEGNCWIYDDSEVFGTTHISGNTKVINKSKIRTKGEIVINDGIIDNTSILDDASIKCDYASFCDTIISGEAIIRVKECHIRNSTIYDFSNIHADDAGIDDSKICGHTIINANSISLGNTIMKNKSTLKANDILIDDIILMGENNINAPNITIIECDDDYDDLPDKKIITNISMNLNYDEDLNRQEDYDTNVTIRVTVPAISKY